MSCICFSNVIPVTQSKTAVAPNALIQSGISPKTVIWRINASIMSKDLMTATFPAPSIPKACATKT